MNKMLKTFILACIISMSLSHRLHAEIPGLALNAQASSVQVDPSSGSAVLPINIQVPPGRAGIQPELALVYSSHSQELGLAGVGWNIDMGSIMLSTKKGVPKYDSTDVYTLNSGTNLIFDPAVNYYRLEIEGAFSKIEKINNYWMITDKKGTKYFYGNTDDSRQYDPANATHIFRWALNRVEDLHGNYMTIAYMKDNNQLYPANVQYTGNSQQALAPFAKATLNYVPISSQLTLSQPNVSYMPGFLVATTKRLDNISVSVGAAPQWSYKFIYKQSSDTRRDLLQSIIKMSPDGSQMPPITFNYQSNAGLPINYELVNVFNNLAKGDNIWNAQVSGGYDRGDFDYGPVPGFDVNDWQYFSKSSGSWNNGNWNSNNKARLTFSSEYDCANVYYTYVYVTNAKTLNVPYTTGGTVGVYLNGDFSHSVGQTWNLKQGYNLIVITAYNQSSSFDFDLNYSLADNVDFVSSTQAMVAQINGDFNGDGLVDTASNNTADQTLKVYLSNGSTFDPGKVWKANFNSNGGTILPGDFTGDGRSDLVVFDSTNGNWRVWVSDGLSFYDGGTWATSFGKKGATVPNPTPGVGDFNGDGISDIFYWYKHLTNSNMYFAISNSQQFNVIINPLATGAVGSFFPADVNGDGLYDVLSLDNEGRSWVFLNRGPGDTAINFAPISGSNTSLGLNLSFFAGDLNSDGNIDVGGYDQNTSQLQAWSFHNIDSTDSSVTFLTKKFNAALPSGAYQIQSFDYNGDGLNDLIFYDENQDTKIFFSKEKYPDLLLSVDNGLGANTSIEYDSVFHYSNTFLPASFQVVKSLTTALGAQSYKTSYSYSGGLFDSTYREFEGFRTATITDVDGNYATTIFLQDHYLRGHPLEQNTFDSTGKLYSKTAHQWQTQNLVTNAGLTSKFVFMARTDNYFFDGTSTAKRTAQEFSYAQSPQHGNLTQNIDYGEVHPDNGSDIGTDKLVSKMEYVSNLNIWLIGLPKHTLVQDNTGATVSQSWFYYDGTADNNASPSLGLLTAKTNWLGDAIQNDPKTTFTYDNIGNLQKTTDALGNSTTIVYDNAYRIFPTQATNALQQTSKTAYYGVDGVALDDGQGLRGLWGQTKSITDANNQTSLSTYDSFGRLTAQISPKDSIALPTSQLIYQVSASSIAVTSKARVDHNKNQTIDKTSFYDGLGRMIETKSLGPNAGQYIVAGQTEYNNRGLAVKSYLPRFTNTNLNTIDPINPAVPFSQIQYDPMGRVIKTINADGTYANIVYDHWTTTTFDENGHKKMSIMDAAGRLVEKHEFDGADGRAADYPTSTFTLYAKTTYQYDQLGNLTSVKDAQNNVTTIAYDRLNRKVSMSDPDMGNWSYGYDDNGNLLSQKDAKGQVTNFTYDALNRLSNKNNVVYNYDDPGQTYGKGRLGSVMYQNGQAGFNYDNLGRELSSTKMINGITYDVSRQYDALNRLKQLQFPDSAQVIYQYNQAGQVNGVVDPSAAGEPLSSLSNKNNVFDWIGKNIFGVGDAEAFEVASCPSSTTITSPANNAVYLAPATVLVKINFDRCINTGALFVAQYYKNGVLVHEKFNGAPDPYSYSFPNLAPGNYSFFVKVWDVNNRPFPSQTINVTVDPPLPTVSLTSPSNNSSFNSPADIVLTANAATAYGGISKVEFYSGGTLLGSDTTSPYSYTWVNATPGNFIILTAKAYANGLSTTSAPVNITVNLPIPNTTLTEPGNSASYTAPANIVLKAVATTSFGVISKVEFYSGATLLGTALNSPYSYTWNNAPPGNYSLSAIAYSNGIPGPSGPVNITVNQPAPNVTLTSPINNASLPTLSDIVLAADASTAFGTINKVEFYNGAALLATATSSPYTYTWNSSVPGNFSLTAKAYSNGVSKVSNAVNVTLTANVSPTVNITAPLNNASILSPVTINANASDTDGTVKRVDFYNGATLLGSVTQSPFTYMWNNVVPGAYVLTAKATDNSGATTVSAEVNVTVILPGPVLNITSSSTVNAGGTSTVSWSDIAFPSSTDWIGLFANGAADTNFSHWIYVSCLQTSDIAKAAGSCPVTIPTSVVPGQYEFRLFSNNGYTKLATSTPLTILPPVPPAFTSSPAFVNAASMSTVSWDTIANPTPMDWIGLFVKGAPDSNYLKWVYVSCSQTAGAARATGSCGFIIPDSTPEGQYEFRIFANNGSTKLATSAPFTVTAPVGFNITSPLSVKVGGTTTVHWNEITNPAPMDWIGLFASGAPDTNYLKWVYVSCSQNPGAGRNVGSCSITIPTSLAPGQYEFRMFENNGSTKLATTVPITVTLPSKISASPAIVNAGGMSTVTWQDIPNPVPMDWIGLFASGAADTNYFKWIYVSCSQTSAAAREAGSCEFPIPDSLATGQYEFRLFANNGSTKLGISTPITVNSGIDIPLPTVNITSPVTNASFSLGDNVAISADAATTYGAIDKVEFYNGTTLLGTATTSPYTINWTAAGAPGNYSLTAKAYANGVSKVSSPVNISINTILKKYVVSTDYNASGQMTQIKYGNGTVTNYTYNPLNLHLMRILTVDAQGTKVQDLSYKYDAIGQITAITDAVNTATQSFKYDAHNRLITANGAYGAKTYAYDSIGNIKQKDGFNYAYGTNGAGPHAVTSTSDGNIYDYDANGNMSGKQTPRGLWGYAYDTQNRLTTINYKPNSKPSKIISEYTYDGDGGRTKKVVYRYLDLDYSNQDTYDLLDAQLGKPTFSGNEESAVSTTVYVGNLYEIEDASSSGGGLRKTKNVYLGSTRVAAITGSEIAFYHQDHLGSGNVMTDQAGFVRSLTEYDPFGKISKFERHIGKIKSGWNYFNDKPLDDESGLIYYGARYYNPSLGRFITPDTLIPRPGNPQEFNRYSYCLNNPVNMVDPSGHKSFWKKAGDFFKKWGGTILSVAFTFVGMPFIGALVSSAFNTIVNRGSFGDFAMSFGVGLVTGYAGGSIAGNIAQGMGMNMAGLGTAVFRGALAGSISGAGSAAIFGGDIGQGALMGAGMGAAMGAAMWKVNDIKTNNFINKNLDLSQLSDSERAEVLQSMRELGQSPMGQREMGAIRASGQKVSFVPYHGNNSFVPRGLNEVNINTKLPSIAGNLGAPSYTQLDSIDLATLVGHEMGHTVAASYPNYGPSSMSDPLNVSYHENPYRAWVGLPARTGYYQNGDIPKTILYQY